MERIERQIEFRAVNRRLVGTVLRYGDVSPSHKERFVPGSLLIQGTIPLNLAHDPLATVAFTTGGGLELRDTPDSLELECAVPEIPAGDLALSLLSDNRIGGASLEFRAIKESKDDGLRVIEQAELLGIALVKTPSYPMSKVEVRAARLNSLLLVTG